MHQQTVYNSRYDSLWLSGALLLVLLPICHAQTAQSPGTDGHQLNVHNRLYHHVKIFFFLAKHRHLHYAGLR